MHPLFLPRRLDKYLREASALSAAQARRAIAEQRVAVRVASPGADGPVNAAQLVFEDDVVTLDRVPLLPRQQHHHVMLNKPLGVTCSTADPQGKRDLSGYLCAMPEGSFPVGRLDRETTGLLLFTTEGDLANALLQPEHETEKLYWLWLDDCIADQDPRLQQLVDGVPLEDGLAQATAVEVLARTEATTELLLTLCTGKNRQIRRMCAALNLPLHQLHRRRVGSVTLGSLGPGQWRALDTEEVAALWRAAGGRERVLQRRISLLRTAALEAQGAGHPNVRLNEWLRHAAVDAEL